MYASWMRDAHNRRVASLVRVLVCSASWALAAAAAGGKGRPVRIAALARVNLSILGSLLSLRSGARFLEEALPEQCRDERGAASNLPLRITPSSLDPAARAKLAFRRLCSTSVRICTIRPLPNPWSKSWYIRTPLCFSVGYVPALK